MPSPSRSPIAIARVHPAAPAFPPPQMFHEHVPQLVPLQGGFAFGFQLSICWLPNGYAFPALQPLFAYLKKIAELSSQTATLESPNGSDAGHSVGVAVHGMPG